MPFALSPLYPILDASYLSCAATPPGSELEIERAEDERYSLMSEKVKALADAGVTMLQYRNKRDEDWQVERDAAWLRSHAPGSLRIVVNDRVHLVSAAGCDGAHVGQADTSIAEARQVLGESRVVGLSTHTERQLIEGETSAADYLAIGPIYATGSKADAEPVIGLEGLRRARALTTKPLVAIGGITLERAAEVRAAGADAVAVISALFGERGQPRSPAALAKLAEDFLEVFR